MYSCINCMCSSRTVRMTRSAQFRSRGDRRHVCNTAISSGISSNIPDIDETDIRFRVDSR